AALSELPDLTAQRKTLRDFLDAIRDDIIVLVRTKGYTLADVRDTLKNAGYEVGEKALRDIIREAESKKPSRRSSSKTAPKKTDSGRNDGIDMNNN
ncbi:molybdopterin-guanine dinucleotide biosynthesis protein MobC, partial [Escherichia coli]